MNVKIIPDDDVAWIEGWSELGADIGVEFVAVHGAVDNKSGGYGIAAQACDKGLGVPLAEGCVGVKTLALFAPATQRRHIGLDRGLIDKDEAAGALSHRRLTVLTPLIAFPADVGAFAFRCHQCFF